MMDNSKRKLMLSLKSASLDIPLFADYNRTIKTSLINTFTGGVVRKSKNNNYVRALQNINLKVYEGERIGLIGHNGAGKTTFLRLISGIYHVSKGSLITRKNIYPMIHKSLIISQELSAIKAIKAHYLLINNSLNGFNDFCQNVIEFSGLGDYIYLPIKTYSEGMISRLQFAILTGCSHECLALDEGFATGDINFQNKAYKRLSKFISDSGTLFLASHSNDLLIRFCNRGLVFDKGLIIYDGLIKNAIDFYQKKYAK
tara:strand:+ start:808 stop:1578 length:771 start_codon:yes stop_codon:yes gene_type:complete